MRAERIPGPRPISEDQPQAKQIAHASQPAVLRLKIAETDGAASDSAPDIRQKVVDIGQGEDDADAFEIGSQSTPIAG